MFLPFQMKREIMFVNPQKPRDTDGTTPLHVTALHYHKEEEQILMNSGADDKQTDKDGVAHTLLLH